MGIGISIILGLLMPTIKPYKTCNSIIKYIIGLIVVGFCLAWVMYILPTNGIKF